MADNLPQQPPQQIQPSPPEQVSNPDQVYNQPPISGGGMLSSSKGRFSAYPPTMRAGLMGLGLLIVIGFAGLVFHNLTKPKVAITTANTAQVSISSTGFYPKTIAIKAGQSVNFTNYDSKPHWVASDPYPKNDTLPGLNSAALQPKDSYAYPFTKAGTYTYHDNLHPYKLQGTVVVE